MKRIIVLMSVFLVVGLAVVTTVSAGGSRRFTEVKLVASDGAYYDYFGGISGTGVAVSGDFAIVGAYLADPYGESSGAAYIFHYNGADWVEYQKLTASDARSASCFGASVAISGDTAIVGANYGKGNAIQSGAVYIYHYDGTSWVEQQKLIAGDGANFDGFGRSVSISGNTAIVGAYTVGPPGYVPFSGAAYIYSFDGLSWVEQQKLTASDTDSPDFDDFGKTVSISGEYAIVGAPLDDTDKWRDSGSAYIFHYDGTAWREEQKLLASDGVGIDHFGSAVSISGNYAVVGADYADGLVINTGSAYVFHYDGINWVEEQELLASDGYTNRVFGRSVSISGEQILVGASPNEAAYLYRYDGSVWAEAKKLRAKDGGSGDGFGYSVAISDGKAIVGAPKAGSHTGSAYIYSDSSTARAYVRPSKNEKGKKCYDGVDNDRDGLTDGADPDCGGEGKGKTCSDGRDNDMDGKIDCADPSCSTNRLCK